MIINGTLFDDSYRLLIDRMSVTSDEADEMRLLDSLQTAFYEGDGECILKFFLPDGKSEEHVFSKRFEADGIKFQEPNDLMFNFNNPIGAVPLVKDLAKWWVSMKTL